MAIRLLSAFFVFLGLALPTLISAHPRPVPTALPEFLAALAILIAVLLRIFGGSARLLLPVGLVPRVTMLFLLIILAWQFFLPGLAYAMYTGLFCVCYWLASESPKDELKLAIAIGLLACALLQSFAGLVQFFGGALNGWVVPLELGRIFGNSGQANHYAGLVFLGLGALSFLYARRSLNTPLTTGLAVWLSLAASASASRSVWLYCFVFIVLGLWSNRRADEATRRTGKALLFIAACSVCAQMLVTYGLFFEDVGVKTALGRVGEATSGQRMYVWKAAWLAIQAHPWFGQGPGTFFKASFDVMFLTRPENFPKFSEHAHNLPLNLAAEFGVPLALAVVLVFALWLFRQFRRPPTPTRVWALACVGVIGAHSMVEYPLWYAYFLVPFGLCMGLADSEDERLPVIHVSRWLSLSVLMMSLIMMLSMMLDYFAVRLAYLQQVSDSPLTSQMMRMSAREELQRVSPYSVFARQAESLRLQSWRPDEGGAAEIAKRCDAHWQYKAGWLMMMRCGEAYALSGNEASLNRLAVGMCDGFRNNRKELREWAQKVDAEIKPDLKVSGRACL